MISPLTDTDRAMLTRWRITYQAMADHAIDRTTARRWAFLAWRIAQGQLVPGRD